MKPVRVLIADDHHLVRAGLGSLLKAIPSVEVVGEASNGHEALQKIEQFRPGIALLDISMPGLNGLEVAMRASKSSPSTRIIILSVHDNEEYVHEALKAGVSGYLLKSAAPAELEIALRAVSENETYLSPMISKHVINDYLHQGDQGFMKMGTRGPFEQLTPRQREVLQLLAEGQSTKEIASRLDVSVKTVETHRLQIMERLDLHDLASLVRYAIRAGLVDIDK